MRTVVVVAAEAVTGAGEDLEMTWSSLLTGRSAIKPVTRFPTGNYVSGCASLIPALDEEREEGRTLLLPLLDRLMGGLLGKTDVPSDTLLFAATAKAGIDVIERVMNGLPAINRDMVFADMVEYMGKKLGLSRPGVNVSGACASSAIAVARAAGAVASGRAGAALVVGADVITEFVFSGFSSLRALSSPPCRPFDRDRTGLSLGEGGAALLLMEEEYATSRGFKPLARVTGWGMSNDAVHITAPAKDGCGLIEASQRALAVAGLTPRGIGGICAHGTGTIYSDAMELTAFTGVFGESRPPLFGIKGVIGHTMGGAGVIEAAICVEALREGVVPPTTGMETPDPAAEGWISTGPLRLSAPAILSTNSGFGGINAALVLEAAP